MFGIRGALKKSVVFVANILGRRCRGWRPRASLTRFTFAATMAAFIFLGTGAKSAHTFMQITLSTATPESVEQALLLQITSQFNVNVKPNPFFPNTYQITLFGPNPNYNPPATQADFLNALDRAESYMATVDSYTYVYGWGDGEGYGRGVDIQCAGSYLINCSTPSLFNLIQTSTATFDRSTCQDVLGTLSGALYQLNLDTPTVVPGNFQ